MAGMVEGIGSYGICTRIRGFRRGRVGSGWVVEEARRCPYGSAHETAASIGIRGRRTGMAWPGLLFPAFGFMRGTWVGIGYGEVPRGCSSPG